MRIKEILVGFTVLSGMLLGTVSASAQEIVQYVHTDALGSPVALSDANGAIIERTVYEPYGAVVGGTKGDRPGFTGHVSDSATGLTYMQQRYYDPEVGAFLSVDPIESSNGGPVFFNRYRYGNQNPFKFADLDGRAATCTGTNIQSVCNGGGVAGMQTSARSAASLLSIRAKTPGSQAALIRSAGGDPAVLDLARSTHEDFVTGLIGFVAGGGFSVTRGVPLHSFSEILTPQIQLFLL